MHRYHTVISQNGALFKKNNIITTIIIIMASLPKANIRHGHGVHHQHYHQHH